MTLQQYIKNLEIKLIAYNLLNFWEILYNSETVLSIIGNIYLMTFIYQNLNLILQSISYRMHRFLNDVTLSVWVSLSC